MGAIPPRPLDEEIFVGVEDLKTVTIKVPSGSAGNYNEEWKAALRGRGWAEEEY